MSLHPDELFTWQGWHLDRKKENKTVQKRFLEVRRVSFPYSLLGHDAQESGVSQELRGWWDLKAGWYVSVSRLQVCLWKTQIELKIKSAWFFWSPSVYMDWHEPSSIMPWRSLQTQKRIEAWISLSIPRNSLEPRRDMDIIRGWSLKENLFFILQTRNYLAWSTFLFLILNRIWI